MRYLLNLLIFFGLAGAIGLGLTGLAVNRNIMLGEVRVGPWVAFPSIGTSEPDPYARASIARRGRIPLAVGDGLEFSAATDSSGEPLRGTCRYAVEGASVPARYWTIAVQTTREFLPQARHALTSVELLRRENGNFIVNVANGAQAGNWIATPESGPFLLVLRLYDTPLAAGPSAGAVAFPQIRQVACS
ncbi:membrane protein [Agaricicola taiwanensis]|uniref:Membrane protein n=1 Tax=Agaricicola taiwanensis TaxID=591372 RepID=A0A8J2VQH7_9RHOB|nr:DUF1214 domain-containing protein [Agaricicola taiwanensis]GGE36961.1 membrane protein [Agaricicola taiwanensis]